MAVLRVWVGVTWSGVPSSVWQSCRGVWNRARWRLQEQAMGAGRRHELTDAAWAETSL